MVVEGLRNVMWGGRFGTVNEWQAAFMLGQFFMSSERGLPLDTRRMNRVCVVVIVEGIRGVTRVVERLKITTHVNFLPFFLGNGPALAFHLRYDVPIKKDDEIPRRRPLLYLLDNKDVYEFEVLNYSCPAERELRISSHPRKKV